MKQSKSTKKANTGTAEAYRVTREVRSKLIRKPWSRRDAIRSKTSAQKIHDIVAKQRASWKAQDENAIIKIGRLTRLNRQVNKAAKLLKSRKFKQAEKVLKNLPVPAPLVRPTVPEDPKVPARVYPDGKFFGALLPNLPTRWTRSRRKAQKIVDNYNEARGIKPAKGSR